MLKVAVCGDSWFSTDVDFPGQSFGEIMCQQNSWHLIDLARSGCSNFAISLQVDHAIDLDADVVIVGTTTSDRIEIPIINQSNYSIWERLAKGFDWQSWFDIQGQCYDKKQGLNNISYQGHRNGSVKVQASSNPTILSESLNNMLFGWEKQVTQEQRAALQSYMTYLHDTNIRKQIDSWIISDACHRLSRANKKFILFIESLYQFDYNKDIQWISDKNIFRPSELCLYNLPQSSSQFHYVPTSGSLTIIEKLVPKIFLLL